MGKWLIKYYPVDPAQMLIAYNLEVLDVEDYCSKNYQGMVQEELDEYKQAIGRHGMPLDGLVRYNNKNMSLITATRLSEALREFFGKGYMMDMVILFDNRSKDWDVTPEYSKMFCEMQMKHAKELLEARKWLYLREVYHMLGIEALNISPIMGWSGENAVLEYSIDDPNENGDIRIHHNAKAIA